MADPTDRFVGIESRQARWCCSKTWSTALRAYAPGAPPTPCYQRFDRPHPGRTCSRCSEFLASVRGRVPSRVTRERLAMGLKQNLGLQNVTIKGIPTSIPTSLACWSKLTTA